MSTSEIISLITAIAAIASAGVALVNAFIAKAEAKRNHKLDSLRIVLDIENQMNVRKSEFENVTKELGDATVNKRDKKYIDFLNNWVETKKESYYNIIDRLCSCYLKNFVEEKEWRPEYRNLIHNTITSDPSAFGADSPYKNIIDLDAKWQRQ